MKRIKLFGFDLKYCGIVIINDKNKRSSYGPEAPAT